MKKKENAFGSLWTVLQNVISRIMNDLPVGRNKGMYPYNIHSSKYGSLSSNFSEMQS